jgi:uncharacterized membrane protein
MDPIIGDRDRLRIRRGVIRTYSALQILNERLARGEIQKDEYTDKKAAILSGGRV